MEESQPSTVKQELEALRSKVENLESQLAHAEHDENWPPREFYTAYYATTGFMLGIFGAAASLLVNIIGGWIVHGDPLRLIKVYLTFPLGAQVLPDDLRPEGVATLPPGVDDLVLVFGCCLYIATGMLLGVLFYLLLRRLAGDGGLGKRLVVSTALALILWGINFYGLLTWIQPLLIGGNWITDPQVLEPWVGALTHLVYGWTMALVYPLGLFSPYKPQTEKS